MMLGIGKQTWKMVAIPAVVTLAVTLLRLVGEIGQWSPRLFSREAGGAGALVGIVWLIPVFGAWFGWRLACGGERPAHVGKAVAWALGGAAVMMALATGGMVVPNPIVRVFVLSIAVVAGGLVAARGWPALARVELAYGVLARFPVALVMLVALYARWGTHYELGPPDFPQMGTLSTWLLIGFVPQMFMWIPFTVIIGVLFGALASLLARRE